MSDWFDVEKDGFPQSAGTYLCIVRGATSLRLMRYAPDRDGWIGVGLAGGVNKSVTHWTTVDAPPPALHINIMIKKATTEGLDNDERLELAQLLRESAIGEKNVG